MNRQKCKIGSMVVEKLGDSAIQSVRLKWQMIEIKTGLDFRHMVVNSHFLMTF